MFVQRFLNDPRYNFYQCLTEQTEPYPPVRYSKKGFFHYIGSTHTWHPMTDENYMDWAGVIQKRILMAHTQWKTENKVKVETQDKWGEQFNRALLKVLISFQSPSVVKKVKSSFKKMMDSRTGF